MTFSEFKDKPNTSVVNFVVLHPLERLISGWSGATTYTTTTVYFVSAVRVDGTNLTSAETPLGAGEFNFNADTKTLSVRLLDSSDPADSFTSVEYSLFYSTAPYNMPYDLGTGRDVEFEARVDSVSAFTSQINPDDLSGTSLSSSGSVKMQNNDGAFDAIYDNLFWERTPVEIYLWNETLAVNDRQIIFRGLIESKAYSATSITFKVKDFIEQLKSEVPLDSYTENDGDISDATLGVPKRRVYGRAEIRPRSLSQTKDGYQLTGTFSGAAASTSITVSVGDELNEIVQGDTLFYDDNGTIRDFRAKSVTPGTITIESDIEVGFAGKTLFNNPTVPFREKNRSWFLTSHEIKEPKAVITNVLQLNSFVVDNASDFEANDIVFINSSTRTIRRISGNTIILQTNLESFPAISDEITKAPVQNVYLKDKTLLSGRDYNVTNSTTAKLGLTALAEFNIAKEKQLSGTNLTFTDTSRTVTGSGTNFERDVKPRDWINPDGESEWYEVASIESETSLTVIVAFSGITGAYVTNIKSPEYVDDESILIADCLGKTDDGLKTGDWLKTASQCVKDLLIEAGLSSSLNDQSFIDAQLDQQALMSMALPIDRETTDRPDVKEVIDLINKSVFGALFNNSDYEITYRILSAARSAPTEIIRDDDFNKMSTSSSGKNISKTITANYRHYDIDRFLPDSGPGSLTVTRANDYISNISDITKEKRFDCYLYEKTDAENAAALYSLLRESSSLTIKLDAKHKFADKTLGDVVYMELDRVFARKGSNSFSNVIGMVVKITKSDNYDIEISDLSGLFNKVAVYASDSADDFSSASDFDKSYNGYYTDDNGIISTNKEYRINLLG